MAAMAKVMYSAIEESGVSWGWLCDSLRSENRPPDSLIVYFVSCSLFVWLLPMFGFILFLFAKIENNSETTKQIAKKQKEPLRIKVEWR